MRPANSFMAMALAALTLGGPALAGPAALQPAPAAAPAPVKGHAATVAMITGRGMALSADGALRALVKGSPVFEGELISTGPSTYLNLKFVDQSLFLLRPNSRFQIEEFSFEPPPAAQSQARDRLVASTAPRRTETAFFRLLKGGFRAVTGAVGKTERERFRVGTPVATIGIRGTDFETRWCATDCDDAGLYEQDGLHGYVHAGAIVATLGGAAPVLGAMLDQVRAWPGYSGMARLDLTPPALDPAVLPLVSSEIQAVRFDALRGLQVTLVEGFSNIGSDSGVSQVSADERVDSRGDTQTPSDSNTESLGTLVTYSGRSNAMGSTLSNPSACGVVSN